MAYYWCSLTFDEVGTLLERNSIVYGETEQEFIRNMSGADLGLYSPAYPDSDDDDAVYFVRKKQLCSFEEENLRVLDLRNYHEAILAHAVCFAEERLRYCRKKKQGKRHKKGWNHHWHKGIRNKLILDSKGMLRAKYSAGFFCAYQLDPKFYKSENNWKENKKCRHQWECHSNPHADTIPA
jgi:hypothetical protein